MAKGRCRDDHASEAIQLLQVWVLFLVICQESSAGFCQPQESVRGEDECLWRTKHEELDHVRQQQEHDEQLQLKCEQEEQLVDPQQEQLVEHQMEQLVKQEKEHAQKHKDLRRGEQEEEQEEKEPS